MYWFQNTVRVTKYKEVEFMRTKVINSDNRRSVTQNVWTDRLWLSREIARVLTLNACTIDWADFRLNEPVWRENVTARGRMWTTIKFRTDWASVRVNARQGAHREQVALERGPRVEEHAALGTREVVRQARRLRQLLLERQAPLALVDPPVHCEHTQVTTLTYLPIRV